MPCLLPHPRAKNMAGDLSQSGVLYEGNFQEWHARIMSMLRLHNLDVFAQPDCYFTSIGSRTSREATACVTPMVSPALLRRVPDEVKANCGKLMKSLRKLAIPFRLFDLPCEIRWMIYLEILPVEHTVLKPHHSTTARLPEILSVTSRLRNDAFMIFYSSTRFKIQMAARPWQDANNLEAQSLLSQWFKSVVAGNAKFLRFFELWISERCKILIYLRPENDKLVLSFVGDELNRSTPNREALVRHVKEVERISKILDLKGEKIKLALMNNWELWREVTDELVLKEDMSDSQESNDQDDDNDEDEGSENESW